MTNPNSQTRIWDTIALLLVSGSLTLAIIEPSVRPAFVELSKAVVVPYIGQRYISASHKENQRR